MRKTLSIVVLFVLCGCGGFDTKQDFLRDEENNKKYVELSAKQKKTPDCYKLESLYEFAYKQEPTTDDLAKILPLLGLTATDATDMDKVYKIDYSVIENYNCVDNTQEVLSERTQYCKDKYYDENAFETLVYFPYRAVAFASVFTIVGAIPFAMVGCPGDFSDIYMHPVKCQRKLDCEKYLLDKTDYTEINKKALRKAVETNVKSMFPKIKEKDEFLLREFKASELITANNTILGKYDGDYCYNRYGDFCDENTKNVTILNAINVLYNFCGHEHYRDVEKECICFAHETYKKVNYQNILYIYEKGELPYSKKNEFNNLFMKCEQKIEKQRIKAEKERYGEAENTDNTGEAMGNFIAETLENMSYLHKMATESRKRAEKTNNR